MDRIVRLDTRQEAALQRVADRFVASHKGDGDDGAEADDRSQRRTAAAHCDVGRRLRCSTRSIANHH